MREHGNALRTLDLVPDGSLITGTTRRPYYSKERKVINMFVVFADNNIDTSYKGEFVDPMMAFLFGVWAFKNGNSMGVHIYQN